MSVLSSSSLVGRVRSRTFSRGNGEGAREVGGRSWPHHGALGKRRSDSAEEHGGGVWAERRGGEDAIFNALTQLFAMQERFGKLGGKSRASGDSRHYFAGGLFG